MNYPSEYAYVTPYRSGYPIHLDYFKPQFFAPQDMAPMASPRGSMDQFYLPQLPSIFYYSPEMVGSSAATPIDYDTLEKELGDGTSQFDPRINYYHEVCVMGKYNEQLSNKLVELRREIKDMNEKQKESHERVSESGSNPTTQKKKKRRLASEIYKEYKCPYPGCTKFYGSEVSMNLHIKLKHDGGTKTERENFARSLMLANPESTLMNFPTINFPPGYIDSFQKKISEKRESNQNLSGFKVEVKQQKLEELKIQNQTQVLTVAKIFAERYSSHDQISEASSEVGKNEKSSIHANDETVNDPITGERVMIPIKTGEKQMGPLENYEGESKSPQQLILESDGLSPKSAEIGQNIKLESPDNQSVAN